MKIVRQLDYFMQPLVVNFEEGQYTRTTDGKLIVRDPDDPFG